MFFPSLFSLRSARAAIVAWVACLALQPPAALGQSLQFLSSTPGYTTGSLMIGAPLAGPVAQDATDPNRLYVATGSFGSMRVVRVDKNSATTATVSPALGSIGGLASLNNGDLVIVENGFTLSILRARDLTSDQDFLDSGEVTELIAPTFVDGPFGFTGAQAKVAPAGNPSGIPSGSLVVQTADGVTSGELLVVANPQTSGGASFRPLSGQAFLDQLDFNGGVAFDSQGNLIVGTSAFPNPGRIVAGVNTNSDDRISSATEQNVLLTGSALAAGIADLAVTASDQVLFTENSGLIRSFQLPANRLTGTAGTISTLASVDSPYLSTVLLDFPERSFVPGGASPRARLWISGFGPLFSSTRNLLWIEPGPFTASVPDWMLY
jgi:hypothetical protein